MSDLFISYSKKDHDIARLLAAFLESQGYSVWWDTSLLSGENFRKSIMTELARARAVIVIWTENSIQSDWVQSEAGRGHAERKLIPVKGRNLTYKDIPPPFDNMHIEAINDHDKILAAVIAQLAKPADEKSRIQKVAGTVRYELLSWFGIIGGAITLATNLHGAVTLSKWVRVLFESWAAILSYAWSKLLFFLPKVEEIDALILTLVSIAILNLIVASRRLNAESGPPMAATEKTLIAVPIAIIVAVFLTGLTHLGGGYPLPEGLGCGDDDCSYPFYYDVTFLFSSLIPEKILYSNTVIGLSSSYALAFLICVAIPSLAIGAAYFSVQRLFKIRLDGRTLSKRLWSITIVFAILLAANQLSRWIEHQPWLTANAQAAAGSEYSSPYLPRR